MTTMQTIGEVLNSGELDPAESYIVRWQYRLLGDFQALLAQTIARADDNNQMALSLGFPLEVRAHRAWRKGDMAQRLRAKGLEL